MIPQGHQATESAHEHKDIDVIGVALVATLVVVIVVISGFVAAGMLRLRKKEHLMVAPAPPAVTATNQFPQPRLEVNPGADLSKSRSSGEKELNTYGWVDRKSGIVRVPIERAMQLLVERGLPQVGAGQTRLQLMQSRPETDVQPHQPVTAITPEATP